MYNTLNELREKYSSCLIIIKILQAGEDEDQCRGDNRQR